MGIFSLLFTLTLVSFIVYVVISITWLQRDTSIANNIPQLESILAPNLGTKTKSVTELFQQEADLNKCSGILVDFVSIIHDDIGLHQLPLLVSRMKVLKSIMHPNSVINILYKTDKEDRTMEEKVRQLFRIQDIEQQDKSIAAIQYLRTLHNNGTILLHLIDEKQDPNIFMRTLITESAVDANRKVAFIQPEQSCIDLSVWVEAVTKDVDISTIGSRLVIPGTFGTMFVDQPSARMETKNLVGYLDALTRKKVQRWVFPDVNKTEEKSDDDSSSKTASLVDLYIYSVSREFLTVMQSLEGGVPLHDQIMKVLSKTSIIEHFPRGVLQSMVNGYKAFKTA